MYTPHMRKSKRSGTKSQHLGGKEGGKQDGLAVVAPLAGQVELPHAHHIHASRVRGDTIERLEYCAWILSRDV